ncbi:hypothetical protein BOO71_0001981 [Deinococcus marmoris]|uniref:Uncharacterized protein n=1 Tax=Deinococcus marmoris TaxID=249408 RepID=A0A1U7P3A1_9DEIO|nr:hypothetical protein BOO71_0001981 [Deinococcus marmoris]
MERAGVWAKVQATDSNASWKVKSAAYKRAGQPTYASSRRSWSRKH